MEEQNTIELNKYYKSITNSTLFKKMLDSDYELYFYPRLEKWKADSNRDLQKNEHLQSRFELLTIYNNLLCQFLGEIITSYKFVIDWKSNGTKINADGLKIRMSQTVHLLNQQYPYIIEKNKSNDVVLAYSIKEYCLTSINLMVGFLKIELCIDIVKSPIYTKIENLINEIDKSVNNKEMKIALKIQKAKKPQQKEILQVDEDVQVDEVLKNPHNNIFIGNSFEVWERMFEEFRIKKNNRTDVNFMFEVMKYNKQIHKNIGYVDIQDWINEVYEISFEKIVFTDHKTKANEKRLIIYNQIIS